jgi:lipopolysaccharide transport system ATP-binding protein
MSHLRVHELGKAYKRYAHKSGRLAEWLGLGTRHELNWVLRDVSFAVAPGDAVGIVGANGAGKSTLLKIISGTTRATKGTFEAGGRIAALLELGIGFHSEFTGRQNVYMAGSILGLPTEQVDALFGAIVDFAEIGDYIDQPIRTYSSGMQVRLAFSVATAIRSDILIVDEALSVGDTYFQHKSFDRIRRFRDEGTTLLFVSHSPGAIKTLCNRAILLDRGLLLRDDAPDAVLDYYNALIAKHRAEYEIRQAESSTGATTTRSGSAQATIADIDLLQQGRSARALRSGERVAVRLRIQVREELPDLTAGILIRDRLGNDVFGTNTYHVGALHAAVRVGDVVTVDFTFPHFDLGVGSYSLTAALHTRDTHVADNFDWWDRALVFQVVPGTRAMSVGVAALEVSAAWQDVKSTASRSVTTPQS